MQTKIALSIGMLAAAIGMVDAAPHNQMKRTNYSACKKYVYSYDGGHNVYSVNENKLVDASDANVNLSLLSPEGHKQLTWNNVPRHCLTYIKQVNGGHNVVEDNENKGIDLSGLNLGLNILKRNAPSYTYYDGGHNVESTNENKLIDVSDLLANVDILKRHTAEYTYINGGHNVEATNENKLIDASHLSALIDVLSKRKAPEFEYYNGGHNVESTNENKLVDLSDLTALVNILGKRHLKGYGTRLHAREIPDTMYRRHNKDETCTCVKNPPSGGDKNPPTGGDKTPPSCPSTNPPPPGKDTPTTPGKDTPSPPPTKDTPKPAPPTKDTPTKPPTTGGNQCGSDEVYINQGHNVVSTNKNTLLDLSDLNVHIGLLDGLFGKKQTKQVPATSTCSCSKGCCVPKSVYYYNGGHNVNSSNSNKGIDLSGLNLGLDIL